MSLRALGGHRAPFALRRRDAEADEGQRRHGEQRVAHRQSRLHDERRQAVGQQVHQHDAPCRIAHDARGLGIFHLPHAQHLAAHQADVGGELRDRDRDRDVADAVAQRRRDAHRQDEGREGHHQVDQRKMIRSTQPPR